jgi:HEAT repeat protein
MSEEKKILESSPFSGIAVPIAIVLIGALIVFGVTKMLSSGKNHRDLVDELNSKTFGNRWVAAYELSKFLASSKIPKEDIPWVIENLTKVYKETVDARTRNFVVLALGSLNNPLSLQTLNLGLADSDSQVRFNSVVAIGNMSSVEQVKWDLLEECFNQNEDSGLKQVALFTLASHKRPGSEEKSITLLNSSERSLRFAGASVLVQFQRSEALPTLQEIFALRYDVAKSGELNGAQVEGLKYSILESIEKNKWREASSLVEQALSDSNIRINTKAKQVLNILKN